jgi:hypothetical protein
MPIDIFDTRVMLHALEEMFPPRTFLRDTFFKNTITFDTSKVDIDIVKGKRRVAAYVSPRDKGHVSDRAGYKTNTYEAPYIKEQKILTPEDCAKRAPSENVYSAGGPLAQAARLVNQDLSELDEMVTRAEEIQASEAMFLGYINTRSGETINFGLDATHNLASNAGHTLWAAIGKNDLLKELRTWRRLIIKDSGRAPTDIILGSDAADSFIKALDPDSAGSPLSSIRVDRGQINPQLLPNGVTYWGYLIDIGCDVWSYDEYYHNGSDNVAIVPSKKIWMGSRNARFDRLYGVIQSFEAFYAVPRFPRSWTEKNPESRIMEMQSAPILVPHEIDSYLVAAVLA